MRRLAPGSSSSPVACRAWLLTCRAWSAACHAWSVAFLPASGRRSLATHGCMSHAAHNRSLPLVAVAGRRSPVECRMLLPPAAHNRVPLAAMSSCRSLVTRHLPHMDRFLVIARRSRPTACRLLHMAGCLPHTARSVVQCVPLSQLVTECLPPVACHWPRAAHDRSRTACRLPPVLAAHGRSHGAGCLPRTVSRVPLAARKLPRHQPASRPRIPIPVAGRASTAPRVLARACAAHAHCSTKHSRWRGVAWRAMSPVLAEPGPCCAVRCGAANRALCHQNSFVVARFLLALPCHTTPSFLPPAASPAYSVPRCLRCILCRVASGIFCAASPPVHSVPRCLLHFLRRTTSCASCDTPRQSIASCNAPRRFIASRDAPHPLQHRAWRSTSASHRAQCSASYAGHCHCHCPRHPLSVHYPVLFNRRRCLK